jgi:hypothetical protein
VNSCGQLPAAPSWAVAAEVQLRVQLSLKFLPDFLPGLTDTSFGS